MRFSDYIVFVDESGDHGLVTIDPDFPVFALSFCVIAKEDYCKTIVPAFQDLKFRYWGHDAVVLHEHEIRKTKGDFAVFRSNRETRLRFMEELSGLMEAAPITVFASVIAKEPLRERYATPWNPYRIALHFCLENLFDFLQDNGEDGKHVHVLFESRGKEEDSELELEFRRICDGNGHWGTKRRDFNKLRFEPRFVKKAVNSTGLQLADLTARPIALGVLRPDQQNRALEIIEKKMGSAAKVFP